MTPPATTSQPLNAIYDIPAPAKLNLFLHITGRRADGYHLIQSVFMLIDWCDTLHLELRRDGKITRSDLPAEKNPASPTNHPQQDSLPAEDLTVRAARALQKASGTSLGVHIGLQKRIPAQAGMGGGSSDAASCLLALQHLWGIQLPRHELAAIALNLGADVPFFLSGGHAWVEGIGEKISPIKLPPAQFLVIKPPAGISTQSIFSSPDLKRDSETATILGFAAVNSGQTYKFGRNDLQPVAQKICPQIDQCLDWFSANGMTGRMTGSGSAVFAQIPDAPDKFESLETMKNSVTNPFFGNNWKIQKCGNLGVHPLAGWLK